MENKNGQGIFYGVIGVATLVVAIIGATFAYFSASAQAGAENLTGQTLGGSGSVLSLSVEKLNYTGKAAPNDDLVPTNLTAATVKSLGATSTGKCEATVSATDQSVYTGCHLFRIVASAGSAMSGAKLVLASLTPTSTVKSDWNYAIYDTTDDDTVTANSWALGTVTTAVGAVKADGTIDTSKNTVFSDTAFTAGEKKVYYLVVWLADDGANQSNGDTNDATGSYTGSLTLSTGDGSQIKATFTD